MRALAAILIALALPAYAADVRDPMVTLERAYVPALAITNMPGKTSEARAALGRLGAAWDVFVKSLDPSLKRDGALTTVLGAAEKSVKEAATLAGAGELARAHDALEHVRGSFWKWRASRGIAFFPDSLTAFHDQMEHLVDLGAKGADAAAQRETYAIARSRWIDVERALAGFDPQLYRFDAARLERMRGLVAKERALLDDYAAAMASGDRQTLAAAGRALKGNFAQTYFLFGDFTGLLP